MHFFRRSTLLGGKYWGWRRTSRKMSQEFLQKMPLHFPVAADAMRATEWGRQLGNIGGIAFFRGDKLLGRHRSSKNGKAR
jgi:hypothetical protein